jgi:hypothetical protein
MDKIENFDADQTMLGRIFDYGDVTIRGTGTTLEPLGDVDQPIAFRKRGYGAISLERQCPWYHYRA